MTRTYLIPIVEHNNGFIYIEADSLEEALAEVDKPQAHEILWQEEKRTVSIDKKNVLIQGEEPLKTFILPISEKTVGYVEIKAASLEDAKATLEENGVIGLEYEWTKGYGIDYSVDEMYEENK